MKNSNETYVEDTYKVRVGELERRLDTLTKSVDIRLSYLENTTHTLATFVGRITDILERQTGGTIDKRTDTN